MAARVCVGGAGAGAEPTPPTLTHSAPQPGRSARYLFFCSAPTAPGSSPTPRVSPTITAAPILRGPPPPPAPLTKPSSRCFPGPPAGCRGYNGAAEKRDLTFHWGRGGETPLPSPWTPSPRPAPRLSGKKRAVGQRMVISRPEAASLHLPFSLVSCAPSPNASWGCRGETGLLASWGGMDAEGGHPVSPSPPPLNNEKS